jgi:hypothetical protein
MMKLESCYASNDCDDEVRKQIIASVSLTFIYVCVCVFVCVFALIGHQVPYHFPWLLRIKLLLFINCKAIELLK